MKDRVSILTFYQLENHDYKNVCVSDDTKIKTLDSTESTATDIITFYQLNEFEKAELRSLGIPSEFKYKILKDNTIIITKYLGESSVVEIPHNLSGIPVSTIGKGAFGGCRSITKVVIPDSVTEIECRAFIECTSLVEIDIPNSVRAIGELTFQGCKSLTKVAVPEHIENIEKYTFDGCTSLTSVIIPNSVRKIGKNAFDHCKSLKEVILPNSVIEIGDGAFFRCGLTNIVIPESVFYIGKLAFHNTKIIVDSRNPKYKSKGGCLFSKDGKQLIMYGGKGKVYNIPQNVTVIESYAFVCNFELETIRFSDDIEKVDKRAIQDCFALQTVFLSKKISRIGDFVFSGCGSLTEIIIPDRLISDCLLEIGKEVFKNSGIKSISLPISLMGKHDFDINLVSYREIVPRKKRIAVGVGIFVGIKENGAVLAVGEHIFEKYNVTSLEKISSVSVGSGGDIFGIKDGEMISCSSIGTYKYNESLIIAKALSCGLYGLTKKGTLLKLGGSDYILNPDYFDSCIGYEGYNKNIVSVKNWVNIADFVSFGGHVIEHPSLDFTYSTICIVGLKKNGTLIAAYKFSGDNKLDFEKISHWNGIVAIDSSRFHLVALTYEGKVYATGNNNDGECNTDLWENIIAVCAGDGFTVGLKKDGTLVVAGRLHSKSKIDKWTDIIEIDANYDKIFALKKDGSVVTNKAGLITEQKLKKWKLF